MFSLQTLLVAAKVNRFEWGWELLCVVCGTNTAAIGSMTSFPSSPSVTTYIPARLQPKSTSQWFCSSTPVTTNKTMLYICCVTFWIQLARTTNAQYSPSSQKRCLRLLETDVRKFLNSARDIIYNKPTRCNSGSIVFINNCRYALLVSDALCVHHQEHYKL